MDRIVTLTNAYLSDELSPAERNELAQLLDADPNAAAIFAEFCVLDGRLGQRLSTDGMIADVDDMLRVATSGQSQARAAVFNNANEETSRLRQTLRRPASIAIAVSISFLAVTLFVLSKIPVNKQVAKDDAPAKSDDGLIASLTAVNKPVWHSEYRLYGRTPRIAPGKRLVIRSGLIEITYDTGALVVIEGPAEYVVGGEPKDEDHRAKIHPSSLILHPSNSGYLYRGRLVARVNTPSARHFNVETPTTRVEDIGTEFALNVDGDGVTDLHVIEGEVLLGGKLGLPARSVVAGESLQVMPGATGRVAVAAIEHATAGYARSVKPKQPESPDGAIAYWHFNQYPVGETIQFPLDANQEIVLDTPQLSPSSGRRSVVTYRAGDGTELGAVGGKPAGSALAIRSPTAQDGLTLTFDIDTTSHRNLRLSFAYAQPRGGFESLSVEARGSANDPWTVVADVQFGSGAIKYPRFGWRALAFDLSAAESLNDNTSAQLRIVHHTSSGSNSYANYDNILVSADRTEETGKE